MAAAQTVLFTPIPNGATVTGDQMPVSVFVSPRLTGASRLHAFPDWLRWTRHLKQHGLELELRCHGGSFTAAVDKAVLQPALWEQLFQDDTLVRSRKYDDYTGHGVISYPVRDALSAVKGIYQEGSVTLALPTGGSKGTEGHQTRNRGALAGLVDGLDVHWDGREAPKLRAVNRARNRARSDFGFAHAAKRPLDAEGLTVGKASPAELSAVARDFATYHRMPTPDRDEHPLALDADNLLDFHQALSSLASYPKLLRALGLVFDLHLPRTFVVEAPFAAPGTLSVHRTNFAWQTPTTTPELGTAYVHQLLGPALRLFVAAPRAAVDPNAPTSVLGLLDLDPQRFGVAQVDIDGAMHKAIMLADSVVSPDPAANLFPVSPEPAPHPEAFDPGATLPSLRSGGFSLYSDGAGAALIAALSQSKAFDQALEGAAKQPRPFFAEDLVRGYRLDVWDADSKRWHSLHRRNGDYAVGKEELHVKDEEGFIQLAPTQPAPGAKPADKDLYLHEVFARWAGWSLSVSRPGKALSRFADPDKAIPQDGDPDYATDQAVTPFKMTVRYHVVPGSLPVLRFGKRYRFRARAVDLAGNSLELGDPFGDLVSAFWGIPRDQEGFAYLRYEPVAAPLVVLRDAAAVTDPGSSVERLVIRTFNDAPEKDGAAADTHAAERHLVPPRTAVELGERHGMFDDAAGKLQGDAATWNLIGARDAGELPQSEIVVAGQTDHHPIVVGDSVGTLPYLPDPFSRGVALRDLPGAPDASLARVAPPGAGAKQPVAYETLNDPNPRPGSAALIPFGDGSDWRTLQGLRIALSEPAAGASDLRPTWDPTGRVLTCLLAKGTTQVVPLSSYLTPDDLKRMGVWQWLREYVERLAVIAPHPPALQPGREVDRIAHVLQRTVEGGHFMLTPPKLLTLVHAVQQPLGLPELTALHAEHEKPQFGLGLQTEPIAGRRDPTELAPLTSGRVPGATDAYLLGAAKIHGASTQKVDLAASWDDPVDDLADPAPKTVHRAEQVDELPLPVTDEGYLFAPGKDRRSVGYYDPEHDQIAFVRAGDRSGEPGKGSFPFGDAAPRHQLGDTRHHRIAYTATATSRYKEYFAAGAGLDFSRSSAPVAVDVPASARPLAPDPAFVIPTFGWQRQSDTNVQRSVRFGGGLRIYLRRPWYSSGEGELLGVTLWNTSYPQITDDLRVRFKPYISQWGMDPIWDTHALSGVPSVASFPGDHPRDFGMSLEERPPGPDGQPGRVDVVGFPTTFDPVRGLWFADLTVELPTDTYAPFVRLALARYQPNALAAAKISRVVLADFAQLTPTRAALVSSDPHHARRLRIVVSGVAPRGPAATVHAEPPPKHTSSRATELRVRLEERDPDVATELGWRDAPASAAVVTADADGPAPGNADLALWAGTVIFDRVPEPGRYRLVIEERELVSARYTVVEGHAPAQPSRLVYAEVIPLAADLVRE